jgi:5-methylcytosine-specific restriction endonuclease McrA
MEMTADALRKLYVDRRKTTTEIAAMFGYTSPNSISSYLKRFGIPIRQGRDAQLPVEFSKELLYKLYIKKELSVSAVAQRLHTSEETIRRMLVGYGIPRRSKTAKFGGWNKGTHLPASQREAISEKRTLAYATGELTHWNKNRSWSAEVRNKISKSLLKGRTPAESYYGPEWRQQRTACLQRDGFACQQCEATENLHVHHWEPYRFSFDNSLENLVTLCAECHRDVHNSYRDEGFTTEAEEAMYG